MTPKYSAEPPDLLIQRLQSFGNERRFRRRAVVVETPQHWALLLCTVETLVLEQADDTSGQTLHYGTAILFEDTLTGEESLRFVESLSGPNIQLAGVAIPRGPTPQWTTEWLAANNDYMAHGGHACMTQYAQSVSGAGSLPLLSPNLPFYPDIESAVRSWLPLRLYHGASDGRRGSVIILLPEIRAYFAGATFSDQNGLVVRVEGTQWDALSLLIKGAYWDELGMHQLEVAVNGPTTRLPVPGGADRLECYLMDHSGKVYDFHREDRYVHGLRNGDSWCLPSESMQTQIRDACAQGEGLHIEFKPFVDPNSKLNSPKDGSKLREVIETAVAFSNTAGGTLYLGIDDYCTIEGINQSLAKCYRAEVAPELVNRYLSELKSRIKNEVAGEIALRLSHQAANDRHIVIITVEKGMHGVTTIRDDHYYYVRRGASTMRLPPDQWATTMIASPSAFEGSTR